MMEFLFEFLVDGRNLAGKGLSFAEWLQAKTEDEKETFEEVAKHNVDLTKQRSNGSNCGSAKTTATSETRTTG